MLEKPNLPDERLMSCLRKEFGLDAAAVTFLPIGADVDTAVYRADCGGEAFFVKLRRGDDAGMAVEIARLLHERGIDAVVPPIRTRDGALSTKLEDFTVSVSPFIAGPDGFSRELSDDNWIALGKALKRIHTAELPASISEHLSREDFSGHWRDLVRTFQEQAEAGPYPDAAAEQLVAIMRERREAISTLVEHAERLGKMLQRLQPALVPCHADIHGGNVLIDAGSRLHIFDWDTFMLAPKERDLMFIGGGIGSGWRGNQTEALFYQGYGPTGIDLAAIAYYRCERIVQDFAEFGKQLLLSGDGGADREQSLVYVASNFEPGSTIDIALASVECARKSPYANGDSYTRTQNE